MDDYGWMPCMNCMMMNMQEQPMMMNMPEQPVMDIEEEQLKMMYPRVYVILMPHVKHHCDRYEEVYGVMSCPRREDIEAMTDKIYKTMEEDMDEEFSDDDDDRLVRQFGRRRFGRDLIFILLLSELIRRRRRRRRRRRPRRRPRPY